MLSNNTYIDLISELSINSKGYTKYLKWYISIIEKANTRKLIGYKEKHHIVPKCLFNSNNKDLHNLLYESSEHPDNFINLTAEEHQTVHLLLTKMFSENFSKYNSLIYAANMMSTSSNGRRLTNKCYGWLKRALSKTTKMINEEKIKNGTHLFLNSEFQSWISKKRVYDGTHNLLGGDIQRKSNQQRLENGTHHFLTDNPNNKRIANGTHNFSGGELVRSLAARALYKEVKELYKMHNLKIPKNTFMRSDEYLKNIKQELLSI